MNFEDRLKEHLEAEADEQVVLRPTPIGDITGAARGRTRRRNGVGGLFVAAALAGAAFLGVNALNSDDGTGVIATEPETSESSDGDPTVDSDPAVAAPQVVETDAPVDQVIRVDDGYVGFGNDYSYSGSGPGGVATRVSTSPDGEVWTPVPVGNLDTSPIHAAAYSQGRYLVALSSVPDRVDLSFTPTSTLWTSADLVTWTEVPYPIADQQDLPALTKQRQWISSIAGGPTGFVVALDRYLELDLDALGVDPSNFCGYGPSFASGPQVVTIPGPGEPPIAPETETETVSVEFCDGSDPLTVEVTSAVNRPPTSTVLLVAADGTVAVSDPLLGAGPISVNSDGDQFFASSLTSSATATSTDGITWTPLPEAPGMSSRLVGYGDRVIGSTFTDAQVVTSVDRGATWTTTNLGQILDTDSAFGFSIVDTAVGPAGFAATVQINSAGGLPPGFVPDGPISIDLEGGYRLDGPFPSGPFTLTAPDGSELTYNSPLTGPSEHTTLSERSGTVAFLDPETGETLATAPLGLIGFQTLFLPGLQGDYVFEQAGFTLTLSPPDGGITLTDASGTPVATASGFEATTNGDPADGFEFVATLDVFQLDVFDSSGQLVVSFDGDSLLEELTQFPDGPVTTPEENYPFSITLDGYTVEGEYPTGIIVLTDSDGIVVGEWDSDGDLPEDGSVVFDRRGLTFIDPETGEELITISEDDVLAQLPPDAAAAQALPDLPEPRLVFSPDGITWRTLPLPTDSFPGSIVVGENEVIVTVFDLDDPFGSALRIPLD